MYPAKFDYAAPATLESALALLADRDDDARVLAGGQSLIPLLKLRFAAPSLLVDLNRIPGLDTIAERDGALCIGALARHNQIARSPLAARCMPLLPRAAAQVADPLVRNLGTLCGSVAHADPRGDWASVLLALDAELVLRRRGDERRVSIHDFLRGAFQTTLEPGEIVAEARLPLPQGASAGTYLKLERKVGDFATVGVAVQLERDGSRIQRAGIALTAVAPRNLRAARAEALLAGAEPSPELFAEAARVAAEECEPVSDGRGSAAYKRRVVAVFTERALTESWESARREERP
jgi:aerobic carbon-monoxide dehydrogenase medium subunit